MNSSPVLPSFSQNKSLPLFSGGSLSQYIQYINSIPLLTDEEEKFLITSFREGNQLAGKKVAEAHLRVVVRIALQFQKYQLNIWDIIAEGNIGLLKALKNFSLEKNVKFVTYATLWVKSSIQEFVLKSSSMLKISIGSSQKKIMFNLGKVKERLRKIHGESNVTTKQIANILNVDEAEIIDLSTAVASNGNSLDLTTSDESRTTIHEIIPSEVASPEEDFIQTKKIQEQKSLIAKAFQKLNEREKIIITKRFLTSKQFTLL
jgi:RNA polymerase sigma-32 factor